MALTASNTFWFFMCWELHPFFQTYRSGDHKSDVASDVVVSGEDEENDNIDELFAALASPTHSIQNRSSLLSPFSVRTSTLYSAIILAMKILVQRIIIISHVHVTQTEFDIYLVSLYFEMFIFREAGKALSAIIVMLVRVTMEISPSQGTSCLPWSITIKVGHWRLRSNSAVTLHPLTPRRKDRTREYRSKCTMISFRQA